MDDLAAALREAGHEDLADALRRKALAGELREAGREDLAAALEAGEAPGEQAAPATPAAPWAVEEAARRQEGERLYDGLVKAGIAPPATADGRDREDQRAGGRPARRA